MSQKGDSAYITHVLCFCRNRPRWNLLKNNGMGSAFFTGFTICVRIIYDFQRL